MHPSSRRASPPLLAMSVALAMSALLSFPGAAGERMDMAASIEALIPEKEVTVDLLSPKYPKSVEDLAVRMEQAARRNPAWFQAYTRRFARPLPWHPNLGVSKPEYEEYLRTARTAPMGVTQRAILRFERDGTARRWTLRGWGKLQAINGTVLDLERNVVRNRRGTLSAIGIASPEANSALQWKWYGVWKSTHTVGDPMRGGQALNASLHFGPLTDGRSAGLYWTYRRFNGGKQMDDEFLLLRFPLER
jgi:hypothetical protein